MKKKNLTPKEWSLITKFNPVMEDVDINLLEKHPDSFTKDNEGKENLKCSLEELGQGRPIICRKLPNGNLQIIDGSRIWLAIKELKWQQATVLIIEIDEDEVFPLMCALGAHNAPFRYKAIAEKFSALKKHAQGLLAEGNLTDESGEKTTTRKYLQDILGFKNEKWVSDFERILESGRKDYILGLLDGGQVKFNRAKRMAEKTVPPKETKKMTSNSNGIVMCCNGCNKEKELMDRVANEPDLILDIKELLTKKEEENV